MKRFMVSICVAGVLLSASTALTFTEDFESYITIMHSAGYMSPTWTEPTDYDYLPVTEVLNHTSGGSKSLTVNSNYGTTKKGEQHTFGETLSGTNADPLSLDYWITAGGITQRKSGDVIVMLSMGEVGTDFDLPAVDDPALTTPIPVIAYAKPYSDNVTFYFFDGLDWTRLTPSIDAAPYWYEVNVEVKSSTVNLGTSAYPNYYSDANPTPNPRPRAYLGGFDRISVLYEGRSPSGSNLYKVDDITVTGAALATPPQVETAVSCKSHGTVGEFCINVLDRTNDDDFESRRYGVTKLVVNFDMDIQGVGGLDTDDIHLAPTGSVDNVTLGASDELTIEMSGTTDGVPLIVTFPGIAAAADAGALCTDSVCVRQLVGNVRTDLSINAADRIDVRNQMGIDVTSSNFRADVRADGSINAGDRIDVRNVMGNGFGGTCP